MSFPSYFFFLRKPWLSLFWYHTFLLDVTSSPTWLTLHRTALQHFSLLTHWSSSVWMKNISCHMSEQKMLWPSSQPPLQPPQLCTLKGCRIEKSRILALDSHNAYQRNDFTESRLLHLPRYTKTLNSYPLSLMNIVLATWLLQSSYIFYCLPYLFEESHWKIWATFFWAWVLRKSTK